MYSPAFAPACSAGLHTTTFRSSFLHRLHRRPRAGRLYRARCAISSSTSSSTSSSASSPSSSKNTASSVLVVGKFDAFHRGHAHLVEIAAKYGLPTLLSFSGMASMLGWPPRSPVVAPIERTGILREWGYKYGSAVNLKTLNFSDVQNLSPEEFISYICTDLNVKTIVCGNDWKFGKRAAGNVEMLSELAKPYGLQVKVIEPILFEDAPISSTRVRAALNDGAVELAEALMGRSHRLVGYVTGVDADSVWCTEFVNQVVGPGSYQCLIRVLGAAQPVRSTVKVVKLEDGSDLVTIYDATQIYCEDCEVYIDFLSRVR